MSHLGCGGLEDGSGAEELRMTLGPKRKGPEFWLGQG